MHASECLFCSVLVALQLFSGISWDLLCHSYEEVLHAARTGHLQPVSTRLHQTQI